MVKKATTKKVEKKTEKKEKPSVRYLEAVGRRKESIARIRLYPEKGGGPSAQAGESDTQEKGNLLINDKQYTDYFKDGFLRNVVEGPLRKLKSLDRFRGTVKVSGGGMTGQAQAVQLGIARALVLFDENYSKKLRKFGFLTQDSRVKERRKYGLKKARKAPQWAKR